MVSTRRTTAAPAADEAPAPAPRRAASPRRPRRAAAPAPSAAAADPPSEDDSKWAAHYRDLVRREKEAAGRNAFTRATAAGSRAWHHYRISLGPFMLDPWEQALYAGGILLLLLAAVHALARLADLAAPALAGWAAAVKPLLSSS